MLTRTTIVILTDGFPVAGVPARTAHMIRVGKERPVAAGSGSPDHLVASTNSSTTEINEQVNVTISQVNSGGGLDATALSDAGVDIGTINFAGGGESMNIVSSGAHGLSLDDIIRFTTGAADTVALYVVSEAVDATTFKVVGDAPNNISSMAKLTPITDEIGRASCRERV